MTRSSSKFRASREPRQSDLFADLLWFFVHSAIAETVLALTIGVVSLFHPDPDASLPKVIATVTSFVAPLIAGSAVLRINVRDRRLRPARYCWIFGALLFVSAAAWVGGTPSGPGLCEECGAFEKMWRTFFVFRNASGLLNGDGLLVGCWAPLASFGYALGAWGATRV